MSLLERDALILQNRELVRIIALHLLDSLYGCGYRANVDELVSCGMEGLFYAAQRYDPNRGIAFKAYAKYYIRGAMLDSRSDWYRQAARHVPLGRVRENRLPKVDSSERSLGIRQAIQNLPARERKVLWLYYENGNTFSEIAAKLKISTQRAFQIHKEAIGKLRAGFIGLHDARPVSVGTGNIERQRAPVRRYGAGTVDGRDRGERAA